jgi:putative DNA primase/helicase
LACNEKPKINTNDGGTWRRFVVINFVSKFVQFPDGPNQFKMDTAIERKVKTPEWGRCFLAFLIHTYKSNRDRELVAPDRVLEYTRDYREENNAITKFMNECTRPVREEEEVLAVRKPAISNTFKTWWEANRGTRDWKVPEMLKELEVRYGKYTYGGWKTFQIRDDVD